MPGATFGEPDIEVTPEEDLEVIPEISNDLYLAHMRVPWKILPFIVACFVLVDVISSRGTQDVVAGWIVGTERDIGLVFRAGLISTLLANVVNNQPMSLFMAHAIGSVEATRLTDTTFVRSAAGLAVVIASNLAANITIVGALAGLMWRRILAKKGMVVTYLEFASVGLRVTPFAIAASLLVLVAVLGAR